MTAFNIYHRGKNKQQDVTFLIVKILFLHSNFPAQFRHLAATLSQDRSNRVVFATARKEGEMPGVYKVFYTQSRKPHKETHHYVKPLEDAVLQGQAVYRELEKLKKDGFMPDVVYGHSGWGTTLFIKDIFPQTKLLCYFEWFYRDRGSDVGFDPAEPVTPDDRLRIRMKNTPILTDLYSCDAGLCPTAWQMQQFPPEFQGKIKVLHDGIDTRYFSPQQNAKLVLPEIGLDLSSAKEIVTYVSRGFEPYRGFPQFMETVSLLQKRRKDCHVVVVGEDRVAYGKRLPDGKTYKQLMLEKYDFDLSRLHFTGRLPYAQYLHVLRVSSAHIYLTRPFVLSWSMLEAMSTGCVIVASGTQPVTEVIQDGVNGVLVDFFNPYEIADSVEHVLDNQDKMRSIRSKARETILEKYGLAKLLPLHLEWMMNLDMIAGTI
jgi:glycosyltransferase involved in cell wall biosynthesis